MPTLNSRQFKSGQFRDKNTEKSGKELETNSGLQKLRSYNMEMIRELCTVEVNVGQFFSQGRMS